MDERPHFSIFGVPVRVRATFAITILLGAQAGLRAGLEWAAIVFLSVLAHEMGHAFIGRLFGLRPSVELYAFGGQTSWIGGKNVTAGKSVAISLAGPAVSIMLAVGGFIAALFVPGRDFIDTFWGVNAFWAAFNLLPIMPMDGGNALRSFFLAIKLERLAEIGTRVLGIVLAIPLAIVAALKGFGFGALFLGMFAASNVQSLVRYVRISKDNELYRELQENYPKWVTLRDGKSMIAAALRARNEAKTDFVRAYATEVLAMGQCLDGDPRSALATLETSMPQGTAPGLPIYLHILFEAGEDEKARSLAKQVMEHGDEELQRQAAAALATRTPHPA